MCQFSVHSQLRRDPTRTKSLRARYTADFHNRFRVLKGKIRKELIEEDGFGFRANAGKFEFKSTPDKIAGFMDWLREEQRAGILGVSRGASAAQAASNSWQNVYIQTAYKSGVIQAANQMRRGGATVEGRWVDSAFMRPIHADRAGIAYTRAYQELEGVTSEMDKQISRAMARGLAEGEASPATARRIVAEVNDRVDKIGLTRAKLIAQTETINAHAEASLNAYQEAGVEGVEVLAEFATAGDGNVCPECEALEFEVAADGGWTLDRARGVIPLHPRCRCAWLPQVINGSGIVLS